MLIEVAEECQASVLQSRGAVVVLPMEAGDIVVDQFGRGRVVADDDETRRNLDARLFPETVCLLVVSIECLKRRLEAHGQCEWVETFRLPPPLLRHILADILP